MMKTAILAAAATLMVAAPAAAEEKVETVSATIMLGDLDLDTEMGQKELASRITIASRKVCSLPMGTTTAAFRAYKECKEAVVEQAAAKLAALGIEKPAELAMR